MTASASALLAPPRARGERNNNPTNLDLGRPPIAWEGLAPHQTDSRFAVFASPQFGIRAAIVNMRTQAAKHAHCTLRQLISIWAPPVENNTQDYVASVAKQCGIAPGDVIDCYDRAVMLPFVKAVITIECGRCIYPDALIYQAFDMAGGWQA